MTDPLDALRQQAKTLQKLYQTGDRAAISRVDLVQPRAGTLKRADFLHVVARENDFTNWPQLKAAVEVQGMDRAAKQQRLKIALHHGQTSVVQRLIAETPDLAAGAFGLLVALYDVDGVRAMLAADPQIATRKLGPRRPILHLAFSKMLGVWPDKEADMLAIAELLLSAGADVNDRYTQPDNPHVFSALYGALGHTGNVPLARWLLEHGANPNDGETLYHATELDHLDGLALLLEHGATPAGTNALLRAMDFDNLEAVQMLLDAGAKPDDGTPALHHAARRQSTPAMIDLLLQNGADPAAVHQGASAYAAACVFGHPRLSEIIKARGCDTHLSDIVQILADCVIGTTEKGRWIDPARVPPAFTDLLHETLIAPDRMDHVKALVAVGMPWDAPNAQGLPPVQLAGWHGLPQMVAYFLRLGSDLSYVNGYGGTLLTTIIHGSENCPDRATGDYIACLDIVLSHGVALPRKALKLAGNPDIAAFLANWAHAHPGQVVDHAIA